MSPGPASLRVGFLVGICLLALGGGPAAASEIQAWAVDPLVKVFRDAKAPGDGEAPSEPALAEVARGETATLQVVLRADAGIPRLEASATPLRLEGSAAELPAPRIRWVGYVPVDRPIQTPPRDQLRRPPADFPDPLLDLRAGEGPTVAAGEAQPLWITVAVPEDAAPGLYRGMLRAGGTTDGKAPGSVEVPLAVKVWPATVGRSRLWVTNWFAMHWPHLEVKPEPGSSEYWALLRRYARNMAEHRQNVALISPLGLARFEARPDAPGGLAIDFSEFDRWVRIFIEEGVVGRIEGGHIGGRKGDWDSQFVVGIRRVEGDAVRSETVDPASPEADRFYSVFFPALVRHLEEQGWLGKYLQHLADEPIPSNAESYRAMARLARKHAPELRIIEACHTRDLVGAIDVWVPQLNFLHGDLDHYLARQAAGEEVWFYTCVFPQGEYANRFIEQPLLKTRILHWINFRYGATGYLHWGYNHWTPESPFVKTTRAHGGPSYLPAGDPWIVYPGRDGPIDSIRHEAMRDGIADHELLCQLAEHDAEAARRLAERHVLGFDRYALDVAAFRATRREILDRASRLGARSYDLRRSVLANGLTVVSLEDRSAPVVAVQVWYRVGSRDENPERQGFAHMFEHMMFRGTDRLGPESHFEKIRAAGGDANGFTNFDYTAYVNKVPSNQIELPLWLEAERMAFLKIDEEGFHTERSVVEEERRVGTLNTPYGTVPEKVLPVIFTVHPYRWTPIGQIPHLRAATIDELQAFWDKYYVPSNATLVIAGDVTHEDAHRLAQKHFGWIPRIAAPPPLSVVEPPQAGPRAITIPEKKGPAPIVALAYRVAPRGHPDEIPLQMLLAVLGDGESSRLHKDLVKESRIAQVAMALAYFLQDHGLAGAGAVLMPWGNQEKVLEALRKHIARVREEPVTQRELDKVRNQLLASEVRASLTVETKALRLGELQTSEGDAELANRRLETIRRVTIDDLHRVARTYLVPERETQVIVKPELGSMILSMLGVKGREGDEGAPPVPRPEANRVARRAAPRADLQRPADFPSEPPVAPLLEAYSRPTVEATQLENGLRVVIVPNHEVPFTTLRLGIRSGAWTEETPGVASLAAQMITQGSERHTAAELAEELESSGITLRASAGMDSASADASCVSDQFELAARLLAEVVRTPKFPESELEILRQQTLLGLMVEARTPEYLAEREFRHRLFGRHPYARTSTGEPEHVRAIAAADLRRWWSAFVRPEVCVLFIAGDVRTEPALAAAKRLFGDWKVEGEIPASRVETIPEASATRIWLVDRPGSVQSQIRVGSVGIAFEDPDYFPSEVLTQVFGGAFNSRLNKAVRVEKGLTYGARGGLAPARFSGTFRASTFTKTTSTAEAVRIILREMERLRSSPVEQAELDQARSYLVGSFAGDRETPQDVVGDLWRIEQCGLPPDHFERYLASVKRTSAADLQRVAGRLIRPDELTIVVVGEASALREDLETIAPVTVVKPDEP